MGMPPLRCRCQARPPGHPTAAAGQATGSAKAGSRASSKLQLGVAGGGGGPPRGPPPAGLHASLVRRSHSLPADGPGSAHGMPPHRPPSPSGLHRPPGVVLQPSQEPRPHEPQAVQQQHAMVVPAAAPGSAPPSLSLPPQQQHVFQRAELQPQPAQQQQALQAQQAQLAQHPCGACTLLLRSDPPARSAAAPAALEPAAPLSSGQPRPEPSCAGSRCSCDTSVVVACQQGGSWDAPRRQQQQVGSEPPAGGEDAFHEAAALPNAGSLDDSLYPADVWDSLLIDSGGGDEGWRWACMGASPARCRTQCCLPPSPCPATTHACLSADKLECPLPGRPVLRSAEPPAGGRQRWRPAVLSPRSAVAHRQPPAETPHSPTPLTYPTCLMPQSAERRPGWPSCEAGPPLAAAPIAW